MNTNLKTHLAMAILAAGILTISACTTGPTTRYTADGRVDVAACERDGGEVKLQGVGHFSGAQFPQCVAKGTAGRIN